MKYILGSSFKKTDEILNLEKKNAKKQKIHVSTEHSLAVALEICYIQDMHMNVCLLFKASSVRI